MSEDGKELKEETNDVESQLPSTKNWALEIDTEDLLSRLVYEKDPDKIKDLTYLFNQNISKKNMARLNSLNNIMDRLTGEIGKRVAYSPESIRDEDLVKFINAIQKTIDGSEKTINGVSQQPTIQINTQTNNIVADSLGLTTKESRDKVMDIVNAILSGQFSDEESQEIEEVEVIGDDVE